MCYHKLIKYLGCDHTTPAPPFYCTGSTLDYSIHPLTVVEDIYDSKCAICLAQDEKRLLDAKIAEYSSLPIIWGNPDWMVPKEFRTQGDPLPEDYDEIMALKQDGSNNAFASAPTDPFGPSHLQRSELSPTGTFRDYQTTSLCRPGLHSAACVPQPPLSNFPSLAPHYGHRQNETLHFQAPHYGHHQNDASPFLAQPASHYSHDGEWGAPTPDGNCRSYVKPEGEYAVSSNMQGSGSKSRIESVRSLPPPIFYHPAPTPLPPPTVYPPPMVMVQPPTPVYAPYNPADFRPVLPYRDAGPNLLKPEDARVPVMPKRRGGFNPSNAFRPNRDSGPVAAYGVACGNDSYMMGDSDRDSDVLGD